MKRFNMSVAKIKNAKGEYESIPALRDRSGYEAAKANGYTGTEEEWFNDIYSDGWITAVQELNKNKVSNEDFEEFKSGTEEALDLRVPPWNLDQNIGSICNGTKGSIEAESRSNGTTNKVGHAIPMINSGKIRVIGTVLIKWITSSALDYDRLTTFAAVYINDIPAYEVYAPETKPSTNTLVSEDFSVDVDVKKGDVLSFVVSAGNMGGSSSLTLSSLMSNIEIRANIETPFKYSDIVEELENPSTIEILNALLV
jgi:hypothetical protein